MHLRKEMYFKYVLFYKGIHSKKGWVVSTQIWVKCGQTQMLG